jgi:hypothetical protein
MNDKGKGMTIIAFYYNVGTLPPYKAEAWIKKIMESQKEWMDQMKKEYNCTCFYFPVREQPTQMQVFSIPEPENTDNDTIEAALAGVSKIWNTAYQLGAKARDRGRPMDCDLTAKKYLTPSGEILKVYKSAWEQGWSGAKL